MADLSAQGLTTQTLNEIKQAQKDKYVELFGDGIQVADDTGFGKIIGIYSDREAALQEAIDGVYWSQYLASATGTSLDLVLERMGLERQAATPSTVTMRAAGNPSAIIAAEALKMSVNGTDEIFLNSAQINLPASPNDETVDSLVLVGSTVTATIGGGHTYALGEFVFMLGAEQDEYNGLQEITAITATTFDYEITGAPISPATGSFLARESTAFEAQSENTGAIQALAGAIITIETSVGVTSIENPDDATLGRDTETDAEARQRASESLSIIGGSTQKAIESKLRDIPGVTFATVFQNVTDFVDVNGLPPHSIRAVVDGGADADIWTVLYEDAVSAGIWMDGTETTTIIDNNGDAQPVAFSRPTQARIYVDAGNGLVTNSDIAQGPVFPVDGNDQIKMNLSSIDFQLGGDVWPAKIKEAINKVAGVISSDPEFDIITPPVNQAVLAISATERANIDSDDVTFV